LGNLNVSLEKKIHEHEQVIKENDMKKTEKGKQFNDILDEYKKTFDEFQEENMKLLNRLKSSETELKEKEISYINQIERIKQETKNEVSQLTDREIKLNKRVKEYEILLYKMDLENQNFKEHIRILNKKLGCTNMSINKLNVTNEIKNIHNLFQAEERDGDGLVSPGDTLMTNNSNFNFNFDTINTCNNARINTISSVDSDVYRSDKNDNEHVNFYPKITENKNIDM
jgi:chromosome segregation ATPase